MTVLQSKGALLARAGDLANYIVSDEFAGDRNQKFEYIKELGSIYDRIEKEAGGAVQLLTALEQIVRGGVATPSVVEEATPTDDLPGGPTAGVANKGAVEERKVDPVQAGEEKRAANVEPRPSAQSEEQPGKDQSKRGR